MTHPTDDSLKPCPFCGAGTTEITPKGRMWTGMKYSEPSSVSVRHWCEAVPGQPSRMIERVGRDEASAIDAWNTRALLAEQARTEPDLAPGVMRCARCKFRLHRINLNVNVGTVTAGDNKTEPCPNGCGPLWPVTWKQEAEEAMQVAEGLCDRAVAAERELADLRERLGPCAAQPLKAEQAKDAAEDAELLEWLLTPRKERADRGERIERVINRNMLQVLLEFRAFCSAHDARAAIRAARAAERKA